MPILRAGATEFFSNSPEQTRRLGIQLGGLLRPGDLICLEGELGAGKTTLVQGLAAGWGSPQQVTSPTFVIINLYTRGDGQHFTHLDAYRLESAAEAQDLDLDEYLGRGPMVVEWADNIEPALPAERLWLKLYWVEEARRRIELSPEGERYRGLLGELEEMVFGVA